MVKRLHEITYNGENFVSTKYAAKLTGYEKDYIGQLVRRGKLSAVRIGKAWYVETRTLLDYQKRERYRISEIRVRKDLN